MKTKIGVYDSCGLSTLLYGSETWAAQADQERKLKPFTSQMSSQDHRYTFGRQENQYRATGKSTKQIYHLMLEATQMAGALDTGGRQSHSETNALGQMTSRNRAKGRPKLRLKDKCKSSLTKCEVNVQT